MLKNFFTSEVLFTGYYGQYNVGDDAFVEVASWGAKKYWNKSKCLFLAQQKTLPYTISDVNGYPFSVPKTYKIQNNLLIANTKYLISAGGSTIHSSLNKYDVRNIAINYKRKGHKIKIGGIGVSIGPFKTVKDEISVVEYLKYIDFLAVRDKSSFEFVSNLNLPYAPVHAFDLAALLPDIYKENKENKENKKIVGISLCLYESFIMGDLNKEKERNSYLVDLIKYINNDDVHFKFFIINDNEKVGDYNLTMESISLINPHSYEVVCYTQKTQSIWAEISDCDFFISTRLHAAIFSCFSQVPFILNEYHKKCTDFLDDIEYNEVLRSLNKSLDVISLGDFIIEIINGTRDYPKPKRLAETKALAELNFTRIDVD